MNHVHDVMVLDRIEQHWQHQGSERHAEQARLPHAAVRGSPWHTNPFAAFELHIPTDI
jgi:hypothetical protein